MSDVAKRRRLAAGVATRIGDLIHAAADKNHVHIEDWDGVREDIVTLVRKAIDEAISESSP